MDNFKNVNNDIMKEWFLFREEKLATLDCREDKRHRLYFEECRENILRNVSVENKKYVLSQLNSLENAVLNYVGYWNKKYYINGFRDGMRINNL